MYILYIIVLKIKLITNLHALSGAIHVLSNKDFMERKQNFNLQQMVNTPTRQENILDLFLTNTPSLVQNTETLPSLGTSDHDIVYHELHIKIGRPFQPKRPIKVYRRSNWEDFKTDLSEFGKTFINSDQTDPNSAWNMFKIELNRLSRPTLHIPTKMCKSSSDLPWITTQIIRLIRKRDKMYTKLKNPFLIDENLKRPLHGTL